MKPLLGVLKWLAAVAVFFTLFAFALNNQHEVAVHFFFGRQWRTPLVLVVLLAFAVGLVMGALGMVPHWWRQRRAALSEPPTSVPPAADQASPQVPNGL